jgi:thiol-disulfide isomerase/thioredoxin
VTKVSHQKGKSEMKSLRLSLICLLLMSLISACGSAKETAVPTSAPASPEWFSMELTDVQTGETFTMNDYAGKVVLLETMAMWCPNCIVQAHEVRKLHEALGNPEDLISVTLDVDVNEDAESLKEYAFGYGFEWHFAVAPLEVARALGNLYTAQYLNPPLSPMLIIDREGSVHHLEYGLKDAEMLQKAVEPYLAK